MKIQDQVIRAARRLCGSRTTRRQGTNGKVSGPAHSKKSRKPKAPMFRHPRRGQKTAPRVLVARKVKELLARG